MNSKLQVTIIRAIFCEIQCILQANIGDNFDKELDSNDLEEILAKLKSSVQLDTKQAAVWNSLGWLLLRSGRLQVIIYHIVSLY